MIVVTAVAGMGIGDPPADGSIITFVFSGRNVPAGKPEPVTLITETPVWPEDGDATVESVTVVCAWHTSTAASTAIESLIGFTGNSPSLTSGGFSLRSLATHRWRSIAEGHCAVRELKHR